MQTLSLGSDAQYTPRNKCPKCGLVNFSSEDSCKRCSNALSDDAPKSTSSGQVRSRSSVADDFTNRPLKTDFGAPVSFNVTPRFLLGLIGSIVLFVGVFMPLFSVPIVGNVNYFQNGKGDGVVIIILAGISLFLALTDRFRGLLITGILSLAMMGFTFFSFQWKMSQVRAEMSKSDNLFKGLGEKMLETVQLQWGWAILVIGAGMLIAAALIKNHRSENEEIVSERSNTSLYAVLATAGVVLTAWICLAVVPQFNDGSNSLFSGVSNSTSSKDTAAKEKVAKDANLAKQREPLLNALSVSITGKEFTAADFYAGRPSDYLSFNIQQMNKSAKDIRGFKGVFAIKDIFGDEIIKISFKSDDVLRAGQSKKDKMSLNYNQFTDSHQKLRAASMENLRVEWQPETIMFADGTALNLSGEQTYSIENNLPKNQTETAELPTGETNSQTTKETTTADTKPKFQKPVQRKRPVSESIAENETTDMDEPKDSRVFDNFDTQAKKKMKVPSPTSVIIGEKNQLMIKMPDGRIRLVNQ